MLLNNRSLQLQPMQREDDELALEVENREDSSDTCKEQNLHQWEWYESKFILTQFINGKQAFWNTKPSASLYDPRYPSINNEFRVSISMSKVFRYDYQNNWNWHKSWILPEITVNIQTTSNVESGLSLPEDTSILIYAVKPENDQGHIFFLNDIGLIGSTKLTAGIGKNVFSTLKFKSTSFKHEGSKFNILILVSVDSKKNTDTPYVLWSFISPPVFVDSRKSVRKTQLSVNQSSIYSEFSSKYLNFEMYKKRSNLSQAITRDFDGLFNYFKAPNIRNKIKNPLFLTYRFDECLSLYFNNQRIDTPENIVPVTLVEFSKQLKLNSANTSYNKLKVQPDKINTNALLCVYVHTQCEREKTNFSEICRKFGNFDNSLVNFLYDPSILPAKFVRVNDISVIKRSYQEYQMSKSNIFYGKTDRGKKKTLEQVINRAEWLQNALPKYQNDLSECSHKNNCSASEVNLELKRLHLYDLYNPRRTGAAISNKPTSFTLQSKADRPSPSKPKQTQPIVLESASLEPENQEDARKCVEGTGLSG